MNQDGDDNADVELYEDAEDADVYRFELRSYDWPGYVGG